MHPLLRWTVPGGRIAGIPIRLHLALIIWLVFEMVNAIRIFHGHGLWIGLCQWVLIYVFVLSHELGHCAAGHSVGARAEAIMLWPLGGLAFLDGVPRRSRPQIWTSIAGPLVNAAWCIGLGAALLVGGLDEEIRAAMPFFGAGYPWPEKYGIAWFFVCYAFHVNLLNMLFNLSPAWPLDGGQILVWAITPRLGYARAALIGTSIGIGFAILLGLIAVTNASVILAMLALFIGIMSFQERQNLKMRDPYETEGLFGYDFSQGYTSLEASAPRSATTEKPRKPRKPWFWQRWRKERELRDLEASMSAELEMRSRVEALLEKISTDGLSALTDEEREFLRRASKKFAP